MKHRSSLALFAHWEGIRGGRDCPERAEISPAALRTCLSDTFILTFDVSSSHPFRLAGTRVCNVFGRELRGNGFAGLWCEPDRPRITRLISIVADEGIGIAAGAVGRTKDRETLELELLLLPLRHHGRSHSRLIGTLAPAAAPFWVGTKPLGGLALSDYRYVGSRTTAPAPVVRLPTARQRPELTVYDGGQAAS
ncbi:MAG: hypothetical protein QOD74_452 [Variibacter sp.]|jgi:hypothetical protein|nr:hypothetical protein [Variibacter sp.]